jgi:hypothetical protein
MMRAALHQLVAQWPRLDGAGAQQVAASEPPSTGEVTVTAAVRRQIDARCADCHDGSDANVPDFSKPSLPRDQALRMLDAVAFGTMPKNRPLASPERAELIEPMIAAMWAGGDAVAARGYYVDRMLALPAYRPEVTWGLVHQRAGATEAIPWRAIEMSTRPSASQASPGFLTQTALDAIAACRQRHKDRAQIDACITGALHIEDIVVEQR